MTGFASDISKRVDMYLPSDDEAEGESWEELVAVLDEALMAAPDAALFDLLSKMCAIVRTVLFLPRTVLLTVFVSGRRHFPGARRCRLARHG